VRATGVEEEHGELEVLLDDFIGESVDVLAREADRRETTRARDAAVAEGGRQARDVAMWRQTEPTEVELDLDKEISGDDDADEVNGGGGASTETVHRRRRNSTPGSGGSLFAIGECMEGTVMRLKQAGNSAWTSESNWRAAIESRRLSFDIERETRHRELEQARVKVETRRAKTKEGREARLQRKEEREANRRAANWSTAGANNRVDEIGSDDAAQGKVVYNVSSYLREINTCFRSQSVSRIER
jgi:hypothetical protein